MKKQFKIISLTLIIIMMLSIASFAITETDNGIMKIYKSSGGIEMDGLAGFDIKGYVSSSENAGEKTLIGSTFGNRGYHTFLNVNGKNGEMNGKITYSSKDELRSKLKEMQYTAYNSNNEEQTIDGIKLKVNPQFINDGEQLQITYTLKNTTNSAATISLATAADVKIDGDDQATIERLEDGSGVRLWTKRGDTEKPVQFVFYGKGVPGTTNVDNLWIGRWESIYLYNIFSDNSETQKVEEKDSAFTFSWVNRTINAGETKTYTVLMEVGEINVPNTGLTLENGSKFYYKDVKINGTITDKDLKDIITVHYKVDGVEYQLPPISTNGTQKNFTLDLTSLNLSAVTDHNLEAWAVDSTNCESDHETRTFTITYLKEPELVLSTEDWAKDVTFKIKDEVNESQYIDKYQYRIAGGEWTDCEKNTDIAVPGNGTVKIESRIIGTQAGDYSNIVESTAKIDKVNPTTTLPTAIKTTNSITANLGQTDAHSGIDTTKTMYAIKKNGTWSEWQANNKFTGLTHNTEYVIKTKTVDKVGNTSESEELTVKTDELLIGNLILKLNNASGNDYTENTWTNQNIYVAINERSVGATTKYKSTEDSVQKITETNQETTVTTNGITKLTLSVTDGTNTITSDVEHILKIDKVAPVINQISIDNEEWSKDEKNITGKSTDTLSGIVAYQFSDKKDLTIQSSGWKDVTNTTDEIIENEKINANGKMYFYVKDAAGNISSVGIDTKIDSQGPVITFSRTDGKTTINVTDTGAGIKTKQYAWTTENIEPTEWKNYSSDITYTGTSKGKIYLWAKATDNVGNTTVSSSEFSALKKPTIVSDDEFVNKNISFKLTSENADKDVTYQYKINDGEWKNITKDSTYTITDITEGQVTISARILDNAGRYSEVSTKTVKVSRSSTTTQNSTKSSNDKTVANATTLPKTGNDSIVTIIISLVATIGISIFMYKKVLSFRDIK